MAPRAGRTVRASLDRFGLESAPLRTCLRRAAIALALTAPQVVSAAEPIAFLPEAHLRLMGARYAPAERDFQWDTWIGGGVGVVRARGVTLYGTADVETFIGNERRAFDANQANYHLDIGVKRQWRGMEAALIFGHVSRHAEDRSKPEAVDWNDLKVQLSGPFANQRARFLMSLGHTTYTSLVGYRFEAIGYLEADVVKRPWGETYLSARLRGVTTEPSPEFPRDGFVDVNVEGGIRLRRGARTFHLFVGYEHRNDVYLVVPATRDRALLGFRFGVSDVAKP